MFENITENEREKKDNNKMEDRISKWPKTKTNNKTIDLKYIDERLELNNFWMVLMVVAAAEQMNASKKRRRSGQNVKQTVFLVLPTIHSVKWFWYEYGLRGPYSKPFAEYNVYVWFQCKITVNKWKLFEHTHMCTQQRQMFRHIF